MDLLAACSTIHLIQIEADSGLTYRTLPIAAEFSA